MKVPSNFDGLKFAKKYSLDPVKGFYIDNKGDFYCPSLPNITEADLLDCVSDPPKPIMDLKAEIKKLQDEIAAIKIKVK